MTGWTVNTTTTCGTHQILGGYNVAQTAKTKTFDLTAYSHTQIMVRATVWSIDSWDNEWIWLSIAGQPVWSRQLNNNDPQRVEICGATGSLNDESMETVVGIIDHTANSAAVTFQTDLNEAGSNESYGVDNLEIWVK